MMNENLKIDTSQIQLTKKDLEKGLQIPDHITPELSYLAGLITGDGNLSIKDNNTYDLTYVGNFKDEKDFIDNIISPMFTRNFGLKVKPRYMGSNTYRIRIFSKTLLFFFNKIFEIPIGKKSDKVFIPKILLKSEILTKSFIQGFADADFSLCLKKRYRKVPYYPTITGVSRSKKIMKQISEFLNKKKINHSLILDYKAFDKRFNKFWVKNCIHIYGRNNLYKWMSYIGFKNPKFVKISENVLEKKFSGGWI